MPVRPAISSDSSAVAVNEAMRPWAAEGERPRVLLVARWPVGNVRAHLLANYSALCEGGIRFTFVGPASESLERLRAGFEGIEELEFVGAPVENQRCRLWRIVRGLLRDGRFDLLHSHGLTAAAHTALANLGINVPHLVTLHERLRPDQFPGWPGCLKRWMLRRALLQADAIVTASDDAQASLLEQVPALRDCVHRLFIVPNGIQTERWTALLELLAGRMLSTHSSQPLAA